MGENNNCLYRSPDGNKCAIGRCIQDEKYSKSFENKDVRSLFRHLDYNIDPLLHTEYRGHPILFWDLLQELHDLPEYWNGNNLSYIGQLKVGYLKEMFSDD